MNPRLSCPNTRFPIVLLKPLGHLSVELTIIAISWVISQAPNMALCLSIDTAGLNNRPLCAIVWLVFADTYFFERGPNFQRFDCQRAGLTNYV